MASAVGSAPTLYTLTACRPYYLTILEYWRKSKESNPDVLPSRQLSRLLATIRRLFHWCGREELNLRLMRPRHPLYHFTTPTLVDTWGIEPLRQIPCKGIPLPTAMTHGGSSMNRTYDAFWEQLYRLLQPTNSCLTSG